MTFQVNVVVPYFSAIPEDVITNTWHFNYVTLAPDDSNFADLVEDLTTFYTNVYSAITAGLTWAPWVRPANARMKIYDQTDPVPRYPVYDVATDLSASTSSSSTITPETAICLSFQGAKISGEPQARRRGRIYLGGMGVAQTAGGASLFPELSSSIRAGIGTQASTLGASASVHGWTWVVWSRMNESDAIVTDGWVDNAMDTQRRRGQQATARSTWTT